MFIAPTDKTDYNFGGSFPVHTRSLLMRKIGLVAVIVSSLFLALPSAYGAVEQALNASKGAIVVPANPAYRNLPLTVECRVKLVRKAHYNILIAHETKASATHWELFTTPGDGVLHAYVPGRTPDHVHTKTPLADGKWHWVAMVMEESRIRLFVDGVEKANQPVAILGKASVDGPLAIGSLVEGGHGCQGLIDEVRLSNCARTVHPAQDEKLVADANTVGLWHFSADNQWKDASSFKHDGAFRARPVTAVPGPGQVPGGMSAHLVPLPPAVDTASLRAALANVADQLKLTSIAVPGIQDAALREWDYDFQWIGKKEYPKSRPGRPSPEKLASEAFEPQALVADTDKGPLGTVLRRTGALLSHLSGTADAAALTPLARDLQTLNTTSQALTPETPAYKAHYLAACALRRRIALTNPLLDFDSFICVARGTFEGSVRSNPTTADVQGGHFVTQYFGFNALPGGGLYRVENFKATPKIVDILENSIVQNGRLKGRKLGYGAFATPDLSFDGKTIVFAWTENAEHKWVYSKKKCFHLFKVNVDGSNLVHLTDGDYNDFDPCWLPDGRIAFVSERRGGYIRCFSAYLKVRNYTLFSMADDGTDIRPLSYFETSEWNPSVNNEGQLVYTRWDYVDRENCLGTRFWISNPDGTNPRAPHGNYPHPFHTFADHKPWAVRDGREWDSRFGAPLVEMGIRAVPNSPLYMFTAAPHHGSVYGSLCMLDLRKEDDGHMSQVRRVTPDEPFPETELPGRRHYKYGTPWPLSEDFYLCNVWENVALVDRYGNKELLCDLRSLPCKQDERLRIIDPIPLRGYAAPSIIPPNVRQNPKTRTAKATVTVMDVYNSDLPFPKDMKAKWLRVVQNIPKTNHAMGEPMIGYERENTPRIPLGIVPVEVDGSVCFEAPVAKQLILQVLDENFMAIQSMRSVAFVHPGEQLSCFGCHENTHSAPQRDAAPLALQRPPSELRPECGPVEPVSYYRQIKPIFDKTCIPCHTKSGKGPQDMRYEALKEDYTFWFSGAMFTQMTTAYSGVHGGSRTIPGRFGARASKIGQALLTESHRKRVSAEDRHQVIQWIDCNSLRLGSFTNEAAQLRGELVWPQLDVDPDNVVGIDTSQPALRGNFWHENTYGPFPVLFSEHAHDRVAIMNRSGEIVWEYPVPHPQDVWMLANGNILTTYYQGVREVTRDKQVVWEYKTEKPNEIPNCQPLPNGNVMIGIVGECRLIEVNRQGDIVHQVQLSTTEKTPHAQFRMCRKTPEGTYLVPFTAEGAVREYAHDGTIIREFPRRSTPVAALRLRNGNTLISAGGRVTEYAPDDRVVWELGEHDIPDIQIGTLAGISRLRNGNTIICNWNTRDTGDKAGAHLFEVAEDKRVVWQETGTHIGQVAQCQLLADDLTGPRQGWTAAVGQGPLPFSGANGKQRTASE
jgi:Mala s 1-like protein/hydrazine synthase alpha subunit-like protein/concanavalin A-like lectin/glucanase superfamily protein/WD40 repeat protein